MTNYECEECSTEITKKNQRVGSQISSDDEKPDGGVYTTKCRECGVKNPEKVKKVLNK